MVVRCGRDSEVAACVAMEEASWEGFVVGLWITNLETMAQLEPRYSKGLEAGELRSKHSGVWEEREEGSKKVYRYFIFSKLLVVLVLGTERVELEVRRDRICFV